VTSDCAVRSVIIGNGARPGLNASSAIKMRRPQAGAKDGRTAADTSRGAALDQHASRARQKRFTAVKHPTHTANQSGPAPQRMSCCS